MTFATVSTGTPTSEAYVEEIFTAYLVSGVSEGTRKLLNAGVNALTQRGVSLTAARTAAGDVYATMVRKGSIEDLSDHRVRLSWSARESEMEKRTPAAAKVRSRRGLGYKPPLLVHDMPDELYWAMAPVVNFTRLQMTPVDVLPWGELKLLLPSGSKHFVKVTSGFTHIFVPEGHGETARVTITKFAASKGIELRQTPKIDKHLRMVRDLGPLPQWWVEGAVAEQTRRSLNSTTGMEFGLMAAAGYRDRADQESVIRGWVWEALHLFDPERKGEGKDKALTFPAFARTYQDQSVKDLPRGLGSITGGSRETSDFRTAVSRATQLLSYKALTKGAPIVTTHAAVAAEMGMAPEHFHEQLNKMAISASIATPTSWEGLQEATGDAAGETSVNVSHLSQAHIATDATDDFTNMDERQLKLAALSRAMVDAATEKTPTGKVNLLGLYVVHAGAMSDGEKELSPNQIAKRLGVSPQTTLTARDKLANVMRQQIEGRVTL
jgi:hypothetical protein